MVAAPPLTIPRALVRVRVRVLVLVLVLGAARGRGGTTTGLGHSWDRCRSVPTVRTRSGGGREVGGMCGA